MKLPQFLGIKDQLDIIDDSGNVFQCSTLYERNKKKKYDKIISHLNAYSMPSVSH